MGAHRRSAETAPRPADRRTPSGPEAERRGTGRRQFLGYLLAAPTLVVAAKVGVEAVEPRRADAAILSPPEPSDVMDLGDAQVMATLPTSNLIAVTVNTDGTASFELPRAEVGQGITTSIAMLIAEEMDLPLDKVHVTLADARPELLFNQLTGGSATIRTMYTPVRTAAALARQRLLQTAALQWGVQVDTLTASGGVVYGPGGKTATYGSLAVAASVAVSTTALVQLKDPSEFTVIGTARSRVDARDIVTGRKKFAMDVNVPNALPTMVCRPPTINGMVQSVSNLAAVQAMAGVTDVVIISTGVAVRAKTFGQCIDAVRALVVTWGPGTVDSESDATMLQDVKRAEIPLAVPSVPLLTKTVNAAFTFYTASNSPLETNSAIADVRADSAEIWSSLKSPITAQQTIAAKLGLPQGKVTVHVTEGGGSFGRHLFWDAAIEAAEVSQKVGKPVKLMWHRTDDFRHGRTHPLCTSRVRATYLLGNVLTYEQRHTGVSTDFSHGLGEIISATATQLPIGGNLSIAQAAFELTANVPYNFGITTQLLNEVDMGFHTGSMRNVYSPNVCVAQELVVDQLAKVAGQNPYQFRRAFLKDDRSRAVLDKAAQVGNWGRSMPAGTAQGIAFHADYKGVCAALVEIDCRPATVSRPVVNGVAGPRVTKVVFVADVGRPINPRGVEAQMMGGVMDGIALALTASLHIDSGLPQESSWDNYFYTRQWNVPTDLQIVVMPPTTGKPGGAGEFGVAASFAAVACAYARASGTMPTSFPINHDSPLGFTPAPRVPPVPASPTDGLANTF
jgi:isoquinoline 1-oxidoreductase beta subunit